MLVPDETITAWVDVSGVLDAALGRDQGARDPDQRREPVRPLRQEAWAEFWNREAFIRRESRIPAPDHETDLFAGLDGQEPGPYGWADAASAATTGAP